MQLSLQARKEPVPFSSSPLLRDFMMFYSNTIETGSNDELSVKRLRLSPQQEVDASLVPNTNKDEQGNRMSDEAFDLMVGDVL